MATCLDCGAPCKGGYCRRCAADLGNLFPALDREQVRELRQRQRAARREARLALPQVGGEMSEEQTAAYFEPREEQRKLF